MRRPVLALGLIAILALETVVGAQTKGEKPPVVPKPVTGEEPPPKPPKAPEGPKWRIEAFDKTLLFFKSTHRGDGQQGEATDKSDKRNDAKPRDLDQAEVKPSRRVEDQGHE